MICRFSCAVLCAALVLPAFAQTTSARSTSAQTNPSATQAQAGFGGAVAATDHELFVASAPVGWPSGDEPAGTVYRYVTGTDGEWVEANRIRASDGEVGDFFGRSIFVRDNRLVVGAPGIGAAYLFERSTDGEWMEAAKLVPSTLEPGAEFAGAIARAGFRTGTTAISGDRVFVASYDPIAERGTVHVFGTKEGIWMEVARIEADGADLEAGEAALDEGAVGLDAGAPLARFGWSVAADDGALFVGAPATSNERGAVVVYDATTLERSARIELSGNERAGFGTALMAADGMLYVGAPSASSVIAFSNEARMWTESRRFSGMGLSSFGRAIARAQNHLLVGAEQSVLVYDISIADAPPDTLRSPDERTEPDFGVGLAASGSIAVIGSPRADYEAGLATAFEFDGEWKPVAMLESELEYLPSLRGDQIDCAEGAADRYACNEVNLVSMLSLGDLISDRGVKLTDIWGWEDPVTGKEWVLQARTDGVAFIDISNPGFPVYVGQLMRTAGSPGATWRDVKVYRDHAYIVADGSRAHGVQIFDLAQLRDVDPTDMPVTFEETAHYSGVNSTHNIVINEETGFAYAVGNRAGGETCGGQLHMINIQDPVNPVFAGCFSVDGAGGTHDAQCVVYRGADADYAGREICMVANGSSFIIADVTDKANTVAVAVATYPMTAYTHQGWLTEDHNYFYMNDELDEMNGIVSRTRTLVWDVQDLDDPELVNEVYLDSGASDHNLYVRGRFLYESNYQAGLRILDITDPVNPIEVGHFDTAPFAEDSAGFGGSWSNYPFFRSGVIAVSSRGEGMFLLRKRTVDL